MAHKRGLLSGDHRVLTPGQSAMVIDLDFPLPRAMLVIVQIQDLDYPASGTICQTRIRSGLERATLSDETLSGPGCQRALIARSVQVTVSNTVGVPANRLDVRAVVVPVDIGIDPSLFGSGTSGNQVPTINISTDPAFGVPTSKNDTFNATVALGGVLFGNAAKGMTIFNDSTANLFVTLGMVVTTTDFTIKMAGGSYYETPFGWSGPVVGVWDAAIGFARVTRVWS